MACLYVVSVHWIGMPLTTDLSKCEQKALGWSSVDIAPLNKVPAIRRSYRSLTLFTNFIHFHFVIPNFSHYPNSFVSHYWLKVGFDNFVVKCFSSTTSSIVFVHQLLIDLLISLRVFSISIQIVDGADFSLFCVVYLAFLLFAFSLLFLCICFSWKYSYVIEHANKVSFHSPRLL